ncbi:8513_t:CDS:1 [Dentiscutata erythropus]|uniref:8513_t:CDS:1 n=1 Tax=Dentiscutata erythropus TaxID=1348616 RepID=A0A9N9FXV6_9GLOM|nr:8513_t:CDS:1 [Dentiscutata erythropus]
MAQDAKSKRASGFSLRGIIKRPEFSSLEDALGLTPPTTSESNDDRPQNGPKGRPIDTKLLVQELQKPRTIEARIRLIGELCDMVTKYTFSDITEVWVCVSELLNSDKAEARTVVFQFMISCIRGQHSDNLGFLRTIFYDCIKSHNNNQDFEIRLMALRELCQDGRNISSFEKNLVKLLSEWVNETVQQLDNKNIIVQQQEGLTNIMFQFLITEPIGEKDSDIFSQPTFTTRLQSVVNLLINVVKFNFSQFEEHDISRLIEDIAIACRKSNDILDIECCLNFWDIVVRYGYVPSSSLKSYVNVLCDKVNHDGSISQTSWHIMRNLLKSHCAYGTIKILCDNLYAEVVTVESTNLLRGSILFLGWALWGSEKIDSFSHIYSVALSAMNQSTKSYRDPIVHSEILVQISDLITKFEKSIVLLEWDIILDILDNTRYHFLECEALKEREKFVLDDAINLDLNQSSDLAVIINYSKLILQIQTLHTSSSFDGSTSRFISLIQDLRDYISENAILMLLDYYEAEHALYPSSPDWLVMLVDVVNTFYVKRSSSNVCQRILAMTMEVYEVTKDIYQEKLLEAVIVPMLTSLPEEIDINLSNSSMEFLIIILKEVPNRWFSALLKILIQCCRCICIDEQSNAKPRLMHSQTCKCFSSTEGLIDVFQHCLYKAGFLDESIEVFTEIVKILGDITYPMICRFTLLQLLVRMSADNDHRIYFIENLDIVHISHRDGVMTEQNSLPTSTSSNTSANSGKNNVKKKIERRGSLKDMASSFLDRKEFIKSLTPDENKSIPEENVIASPQERLWQIPETLNFKLISNHPSPYVLSNELSSIKSDQAQKMCNESSSESDTLDIQDSTSHTNGTETECRFRQIVLPINLYLRCLVDILTNEKDWDIYSYILYHLPSQLSKQHLFCAASDEILALRSCLCDWILNNRLADSILLPSDIKKVDVYVMAYQILTILISYRNLFIKKHRDELVLAFNVGLQKWGHSAKPCTHALNVCLYELPLSATKHLQNTLDSLSKIITTSTMSVHILEFLSGLARLPDLYVNFTESDYKRVFGIAVQYIQYSHGQQATTTDTNSISTNALSQYERIMAYHVIYLWFMSLRLSERRKYVTFIVHGLLVANGSAQNVDEQTETCFDMLARFSFANPEPKPEPSFITQVLTDQRKDKVKLSTWVQGNSFLTIKTMKSLGWAEITIRRPSGTVAFLCKLENRNKSDDVDHITLPATLMAHYDPDSQNVVPLPTSVTEMMSCHSEVITGVSQQETSDVRIVSDEKSLDVEVRKDLKIEEKLTVVKSENGDAEQTISLHTEPLENHIDQGHVNETQLDSSSDINKTPFTTYSNQQQHVINEVFTSNLSNEINSIYRKDDPHVDPSFLFLQFSPYPDLISKEGPIPLPDDDSTTRALSMLDLTPVVDFYKIGVLYVGKDQTNETDILSNIHGSQDYINFLNNLGTLVRLKNCKHVYTGGLDTEYDSDGKYAYYWEDDITQVIFHCATLMPTDLERDPQCSLKKRHIGNDYVTIVYNDSGHEYAFDTLPSHFNYINIVISPHSLRNQTESTNNNSFFKIQMQRRLDMPEIGPITEFKMVSSEALPAFARQTALHANIFAQVFQKSGGQRNMEYVSNWKDRLRQIKRFKDRIIASSINGNSEKPNSSGLSDSIESNTVLSLEPVFDFTRYV